MKVMFLLSKRTKFLATKVEMKKKDLKHMHSFQGLIYIFIQYLEAFGSLRVLESFPGKIQESLRT